MDDIIGFEILSKQEDQIMSLVNNAIMQDNSTRYTIGLPSFDEKCGMLLGSCTDITGFPTSGKSEFHQTQLMQLSIRYGIKHLVWWPDVGTSGEIYKLLIQKLAQRPISEMNEGEIVSKIQWIKEHFYLVEKTDVKAKLTPYDIYSMAAKASTTIGTQTLSIDSWKDLNHNWTSQPRPDLYLDEVLSYRNDIAERYSIHIFQIIHPKLTQKDERTGVRKAPGPYDIKGAASWFDNGRTIYTVHRPSITGSLAEITVSKAKPKSSGSVGELSLFFDQYMNTYYESDGHSARSYPLQNITT